MYPSKDTQKRLQDQYVPKDKLDVISLLKLVPAFILLPPLPERVYFFQMEKTDSIYSLSYVSREGEVWYSITDKDFTEAVGSFFAYMLEYDKGDAWWRMPDHPEYRR